MHPLRYRLARKVAKTAPDFLSVLSGRVPRFVYGGSLESLPIFTYHAVDAGFERDLQFLRAGCYRCASAAEILAVATGESVPDGRTVALTFDDGLVSLTQVAVPLLRRYGLRAIAFVVSGLVPERSNAFLTGWDELRAAAADGVLEVGPHSLFHHHVPLGADIVGLVTPWTPTVFTADLPIPSGNGSGPAPIGFPILRGAPRYTTRRAFRPDSGSLQAAFDLIHGAGPHVFTDRLDRGRLIRAVRIAGRYETVEEGEAAIVADMKQSAQIVQQRCPGPAALHLCYPWFAGDAHTDRLAARAGIRLVYGGVDRPLDRGAPDRPPRVQRLPPGLLWRLPGPGRRSLARVMMERLALTTRRNKP
jgi:Polysaccharide deacetylase